MLVDAEKAKEKLANWIEQMPMISGIRLAEDIRAADLSDCRVEPDFLEAAHSWQLKAERFERLYATAERLRESLSAQVAEAKRDCQMWFESSTRLTDQVAELKKALLDARAKLALAGEDEMGATEWRRAALNVLRSAICPNESCPEDHSCEWCRVRQDLVDDAKEGK